MPLSGSSWVLQFPTSTSIEDLSEPFRSNTRRFVTALRQGPASVTVADTLRRAERAFLMHFAFAVARESVDPNTVPAIPGVDIRWVHSGVNGQPDLAASRVAAEEMVRGYGIVFKPSLTTQHSLGLAIDMTVTWQNMLLITDGNGKTVSITSAPHTGAGNADVHQVASSFGVIKLLTDPPHWSSNGH